MKPNKRYKVRIYIFDGVIGNVINMLINIGVISLENSMDGMNDCLAIYDATMYGKVLKEVMGITKVFPLNNYEDFIITCPECSERIDDEMILNIYDENLLSGYNINCHREDCGCQMANVEFVPEM